MATWRAALVTGMAGALAMLGGCESRSTDPATIIASAERLVDGSTSGDWAGYGRTFGQQHYSPLSAIDEDNIGNLGLAWSMDLPSQNSVTEPIAVDGVLYFARGMSVVNAVDAATGKLLWQYDPEVGKVGGLNMRVGWGVRGIAWWNGKIFTGTQDGRLIAIDAKTGEPLWTTQTIRSASAAHVNGAPRVFNGRVLIGFAGTTGAMRGYVTAYDAETGQKLWRFFTVPGDPSKPFENDAMEMAAKTWSGQWWKHGGGAMVWNSMAYDPEIDTIYIGTGSPYPWNRRIRSADKGDNLFVSSIVALDGKTGAYKWHYQTTPGDTWDFDAIMDIELAEIPIDGRIRKVLMQAPKNGFFYVIDRVTGELISAEPYVDVSWATHVDPDTGRPVEVEGARYQDGKPVRITPTSLGGHNWMAMAFNPKSELVYIPANHFEADYTDIDYEWKAPEDRTTDGGVMITGGPPFDMEPATGSLIAWSPIEQKAKWNFKYPTQLNGGVLTTAGNLVLQGSIDGYLRAFDAKTGKVLWKFDTGAPILAPPITYEVGGKQYVTVLTGISMGIAMFAPTMSGPEIEKYAIDPMTQARRVLTFAIGGTGKLDPPAKPAPPPEDPGFRPDPARVQAGFVAYSMHCLACHGDQAIGIGQGPDLRRSGVPLDAKTFEQVVRQGTLEVRGMPRFGEFPDAKVENIRHYLRSRMADLRKRLAGDEETASGSQAKTSIGR
ncbi:MAG: PQQ-dependent dehydrogenase, methanol/ethanol family [Novosphingobium sp.]|nr:PQQ-dependent dehydrogenase, methanol/ethanol family [Novosphingobium sp.]